LKPLLRLYITIDTNRVCADSLDDIGGSMKRMGRSSDNTIKSTWSLVTPNYAYTVVLSHGFALIVGFLINV